MTALHLGEIIAPASVSRAGDREYPILSMTMHEGLVDQSRKFKKQIASKDLSDYKVVNRGQLVVGFPIDEGVLDFQNLYDAAIVSPAYGVWDLRNAAAVDRRYLALFLRSPRAMTYYKAKLRGSTARRRSLPKEIFLALDVPVPPLDEQRRIAAILDQADGLRGRRSKGSVQLDIFAQALYDSCARNGTACSIGELIDCGALVVHKDGNHGSLYPRAADFGVEGVPFITAKAIRDDGTLDHSKVDFLNRAKASQLRIGWIDTGDVLLAHNASVGKVALYDGSLGKALIGTSLTCFRVDPTQLNAEFLAASMEAGNFQAQLRHVMAQSTRNQVPITAQRRLTITLVDSASQLRFSVLMSRVAELRNLCNSFQCLNDQLVQALQSRAFSGQL